MAFVMSVLIENFSRKINDKNHSTIRALPHDLEPVPGRGEDRPAARTRGARKNLPSDEFS
jgi:hypothetical protein